MAERVAREEKFAEPPLFSSRIDDPVPAADRAHFERLLARMDDGTLSPGELRRRRLDLLAGVRRIYAREGDVPAWVGELEAWVRAM
jgi:hypothetical protein